MINNYALIITNIKLNILTSVSYITISHILSVYIIILIYYPTYYIYCFHKYIITHTDTLMLSVNSEHILNINNKS